MNGKIDIQFKDGEYMRAVLPRILREAPAGTAPGNVIVDDPSRPIAGAGLGSNITAAAARPRLTSNGAIQAAGK